MAPSWVFLKDPENGDKCWLHLGTLSKVTTSCLCLITHCDKRNLLSITQCAGKQIRTLPPASSCRCGQRLFPLPFAMIRNTFSWDAIWTATKIAVVFMLMHVLKLGVGHLQDQEAFYATVQIIIFSGEAKAGAQAAPF